jgi:hypothetical protein
MYENFSDAFKARLYDFKYTPFLSSYIFSWLYYNAKLLLIFTSSLTVYKKIEMLSYEDVNYTIPLIIALAYTIFFPFVTLGLYYVTLWHKEKMTKAKQKSDNKTLLEQEEVNIITSENSELRGKINNYKLEVERLNLEIRKLDDKLNRPNFTL